MPKYWIEHQYISSKIYEVEADTSDEARDIVNGINPPKPVSTIEPTFHDEILVLEYTE